MFTKINEGRAVLFSDVASVFNEIGRIVPVSMGGNTDSKYQYYKRQIESDQNSFASEAIAAAKILAPRGVDDVFYDKWAGSTFGGTIQALTQMVAASVGSPVTGLFGSFFATSLADQKTKAIETKNNYIDSYLENNPKASRKEAKKDFETKMTPSAQNALSYTQAGVEGALSWVCLLYTSPSPRD